MQRIFQHDKSILDTKRSIPSKLERDGRVLEVCIGTELFVEERTPSLPPKKNPILVLNLHRGFKNLCRLRV